MTHKKIFAIIMAFCFSNSIIGSQKEADDKGPDLTCFRDVQSPKGESSRRELSDPKASVEGVEAIKEACATISTILGKNRKVLRNNEKLSEDTLRSVRTYIPVLEALFKRTEATEAVVNQFLSRSPLPTKVAQKNRLLKRQIFNIVSTVTKNRTEETLKAVNDVLNVMRKASAEEQQACNFLGASA